MSRSPGHIGRRCIVAVLLSSPAGCTYEKVTRYKPFMSGLEGVQTQAPTVGAENPVVPGSSSGEIVVENPDGSRSLVSRSAKHLLSHVQRTLKEDDPALFVAQVLSQATADEFRARGMDPAEAFRMLKEDRQDIARLGARMPMGEHSPNVLVQHLAPGVQRIKLTGRSTEGLKYIGFDMVLEGGRLVPQDEAGNPIEKPAPAGPSLEEIVEGSASTAEVETKLRAQQAARPRYRFEQSQWRLRWFIGAGE